MMSVLKKGVDVFVHKDGRIWSADSLIKASEKLDIIEFDLSTISLDDTNFITWNFERVHDVIVHYKRIRDADLSIPIILRSDGVVMNGRHRIIKALAEGIKTLPAKQFINDPESDIC